MTNPIHFVASVYRQGWKCETPITTTLSPLTCLKGPNGSGKSAVVTAMQLGSRGSAWGVLQKNDEVAAVGTLVASMRGDSAVVRLKSSRNIEAVCSIENAGGTLRGPLQAGELTVHWACQELEEALTPQSGPANLIAWHGGTYDQVRAAMPLSLQSLLDEARVHASDQGWVDHSIAVLDKAAKAMRRRLTSSIKTRKGHLREPREAMSALAVEEAEASRAECDKLLEEAVAWETWQRSRQGPGEDLVDGLQAEVEAKQGRLQSLEESLAQWQEYRRGLEDDERAAAAAPKQEIHPVDEATLHLVQVAMENGYRGPGCPACGAHGFITEREHARHAGLIAPIVNANVARQAAIDEAAAAADEADRTVASVQSDIRHLSREIRTLEQRLRQAKTPAPDLDDAPTNPEVTSSEVRETRNLWIQEAQRRRALLREHEAYAEGTRLVEKEGARKAKLTSLIQALKKVATKLAQAAIDEFVSRVNDRLPAGWRYEITTKRMSKNVFLRTMIEVRPGEPERFMYDPSGGQYCSMVIAEAAAMVDMQVEHGLRKLGKDDICVYCPTATRERAWSPVHLAHTMKALADMKPQGQVLLESTVDPAKAVPEWAVPSMGTEEAVSGHRGTPSASHAAAPTTSDQDALEAELTYMDEVKAFRGTRRKVLEEFLKDAGKRPFQRLYKELLGSAKPRQRSYEQAIEDIIIAELAQAQGTPPGLVTSLLLIKAGDLHESVRPLLDCASNEDVHNAWLHFHPVTEGALRAVPASLSVYALDLIKALAPSPADLEYLKALGHRNPATIPCGSIREIVDSQSLPSSS